MNRILSFCFVLLLDLIAVQAETNPNILIIMADDLGYSDLGCYGGEIKTPHLDGLAENGLRYSQFYNTGRCWPTRTSIMTGYYPQQIGRDKVLDLNGGGRGVRPGWAPLIPTYLKSQGYRAYHSGKWHIDGKKLANGFDHSYGMNDQHRFFNPISHELDDVRLPPVPKNSGFYATIAVTNKFIDFLKAHDKKHSEQPFFGYLAYAAPHFPLHALSEDIEAVGDRYKNGWEKVRQQRWERLRKLGIINGSLSEVERKLGPPYEFKDTFEILGEGEVKYPLPWNQLTDKQKAFQEKKMAIHAAMIERMDTEIGRVIQQIKDMNQFENTLIVFLSDNGASAEIMVRADGHNPEAPMGSAESHLCLGPGWSTVANTPFRKHKTWTHEGGISTPFIAHWPHGIKAKGEWRHQPAHVVDVLPTLLEMTGQVVEKEVPFPGTSIKASFNEATQKNRTLWFAHDNHHAIRIGNWKLVQSSQQNWELYNLGNDRAETQDLAEQYPEKVKELEKAWLAKVEHFRKYAPIVKSLKKKKKK